MKQIESVEFTEEETLESSFRGPSNFYILTAFGTLLFYKTRSRAKAQEQCDLEYNGKYKIRSWKIN